MKTVCTLICSLFVIFSVQAQDYSTYYTLCNEADSLAYKGKKEKALTTLEQAFHAVEYVQGKKYRKAYLLSIELKAFEKAVEYGKKMVIHSGEKRMLNNPSKPFKKSVYYRQLKDSTASYLNSHAQRINHEFKMLIDSLYFIDQYIIRKNTTVKSRYRVNTDALPKNRYDLDALNWQLLHASIQKYGFPSEQLVGQRAYEQACILLIHNLRLKENESYHQEFIAYVFSGKYDPNDFYFWYEQYQTRVKGTTFFTLWDGNTDSENLKRIDKNRRHYFLKGISSWKIRKGRKRFRPKQLW